jgi:hypothetical protein
MNSLQLVKILDSLGSLLASDFGELQVVPFGAAAKAMSGAAGAFASGAYTEFAADVGSGTYKLWGFVTGAMAGTHFVELALGDASSEVVFCQFMPGPAGNTVRLNSNIIPPNSRISGHTASVAGGSQAVTGWLILIKIA